MTMPKSSARGAFRAPAAKAKPAVPAYEVTFTTAQWPEMLIDESEGEMIARVAREKFALKADAVLATPPAHHIGQGDGDSCLFEVFIKASAIKPMTLARHADVIAITAHGVALPKAPKPPVDRQRLKIK